MTIHQHIAAGIDLGSNTFRLLVADCSARSPKVLAKKLATVRLGRGLDVNGLLQRESMEKGLTVLRSFREILDHFRPRTLRICGTQALRQAENSPAFLLQAEEILQQRIEIINGKEEATLSFAGVAAGLSKPLVNPILLVDVGGGSTELLAAELPAGVSLVKSIPLGVVGLTEKFMADSGPAYNSLDYLVTETLKSAFQDLALLPEGWSPLIIGCGGTATSMAALDQGLKAYNESLVHGHVLHDHSLEKLWKKLVELPAKERCELPCLGDGRGEILPAGIRIFQILLKLLGQDYMKVSDTGLLEGIMLSSLPTAAG